MRPKSFGSAMEDWLCEESGFLTSNLGKEPFERDTMYKSLGLDPMFTRPRVVSGIDPRKSDSMEDEKSLGEVVCDWILWQFWQYQRGIYIVLSS